MALYIFCLSPEMSKCAPVSNQSIDNYNCFIHNQLSLLYKYVIPVDMLFLVGVQLR